MKQDWSHADVVYCCTTSYTQQLMTQLSIKAEKLKVPRSCQPVSTRDFDCHFCVEQVGARVVTISYPLVSRMFEVR